MRSIIRTEKENKGEETLSSAKSISDDNDKGNPKVRTNSEKGTERRKKQKKEGDERSAQKNAKRKTKCEAC